MFTVATSTIVSLLTARVFADRAVDWFEINCPGSSGDESCTYTNQNDVDIAVSLFFQTEDQSGSSFQCIGGTRAPEQISKPLTCPSPMIYQFKDYWSYCLLENLEFPSDLSKVQEYCDYIDQGYEGFTFQKSDFPNYKCPSSMRQGANSDGTVFCTYDLPSSTTSNLPNDTQPFCTLQAFQAGELGFRFNNNGSTPTPTSHTSGTVYCSRAWNDEQEGSAGDCYFILPAKESFSCSGSGDTNFIGAHAVKLAASNFEAGSTDIKSVTNYTNTNKDKDEWIYLEIESAGKNMNSLQCNYRTSNNAIINVCNFTAEAAASSRYSCNFALPAGKQMRCNQKGDMYVSSAVVRTMTKSMFNAEPMNNIALCPNKTYPDSTFCDCAFENPSDTDDMLIIMEAVNMDNQFDSYHCYVWGVNMCAWGANNNNLNDAGGCYFVLPAGAMYNCSMQWGSTSFLSSTAIKLDGTMYPKPTLGLPPSSIKPDGMKLPDSRDYMEMEELFYKWMSRHDKHYVTYAEEFERFKNFRQFVSLVDNNNHGVKVSEIKSETADLTIDEFNNLYRDCAIPATMYDKQQNAWKVPDSIDMDNLPTSVDWRTKGDVTPVKNQGQCGSCWAFSTTGVLESHWSILKGDLQSLSEEDIVDCDTSDGNAGCGGGWPYKAIDWVGKNGIDTETSYPYTAGNGNTGSCKSQDGKKADISGHVTGHQMVESNEDAMAAYVANYGPISISLDAMTQIWWPYTDQSGIMTGCCNKAVDHAVLIVGYGVETNTSMPYWIIKNSWGTDWGYDGYIYLQRGTDQCGITYSPVVPTLKA